MIIKIMKDRRDNDKIKLVHDKRSPFGPYKMDKVERQSRGEQLYIFSFKIKRYTYCSP